MLHIYCGNGKGKTTAAMGLALRCAGREIPVLIAQFLKGADTGERRALAALPGVTLLPVPEEVKFSFRMNTAERAEAKNRFLCLCQEAERFLAAHPHGLVVLDEACAAVSTGLLPLEALLAVLDSAPAESELVLTGREPAPALLERADYITEMKLVRHPFERGVRARRGIEY